MKKKSLLKLADFLMKYKPKKNQRKFHLNRWACGTSACAIGLGIVNKITPKGLDLVYVGSDAYSPHFVDSYRYKYAPLGFCSVAAAYNIETFDAECLFGSSYYPHKSHKNPKMVARRIYKFVKNEGLNYEES